jgi:hypothetical protein
MLQGCGSGIRDPDSRLQKAPLSDEIDAYARTDEDDAKDKTIACRGGVQDTCAGSS